MCPLTTGCVLLHIFLALQAFDLERTGTINKKELREIMRRLGTEVSETEV